MQGNSGIANKRVRNLVIISTLSAIILIVSTYAWFIGMRTVNVSSFDVEIASTDGLLISIDGETWDTTLAINSTNYDTAAYDDNTNNWGGDGLLPMSSIGVMDYDASRMKIYEKASLTATPGGYRLMASRVNNYEVGDPERNGYVVFDLFVKNFSGTQYIQELNTLDEEAIYLTTDSAVTVAATGVPNTGIENSVRVAFAQIGRVAGTTTLADTITGITCEKDDVSGLPSVVGDVTGICRTAQIWEPNDLDHVANAISWYDTSCIARVALGTDVTDPDSYSGNCGAVVNGTSYPTYAVSNDIASTDNVDIYDGAAYNTYASTTKLVSYPYFTDTMKNLTGTTRPLFMTLEPNSITKVRVYIYIEGQDIDNYDFASIGKKIAVNFGFTKERFTEDDIDYNENGGPDLESGQDIVKPVITLLGNAEESVVVNAGYVDAGATALDDVEGDITSDIVVTSTVDPNQVGDYTVTYNVTDWAGNVAETVTRIVHVTAG